tara:strand:- start:932 stop:1186 length:255 start_codon:yes stop_codon:yes gene_type:complete
MIIKKYIHFDNESHGYLKVSKADIELFNFKPSDFKDYSFIKGDFFYLEEDCHATKFVKRVEEMGYKPEIEMKYVSGNYDFGWKV